MVNYFRARREQLGVTQQVIADRLGLTVQAVSGWERGNSPAAHLWDAIAVVYGVPISRVSTEVLKMIRAKRNDQTTAIPA